MTSRSSAGPHGYRVLGDTPACWEWPVTDEMRDLVAKSQDKSLPLLDQITAGIDAEQLFSGGLCALCGNEPARSIRDHDHRTGKVRGNLCPSCNIREGIYRYGDDDVFARYRRKYPHLMLGIDEPYDGIGWDNGVPVGGWDFWLDDGGNAMTGVL